MEAFMFEKINRSDILCCNTEHFVDELMLCELMTNTLNVALINNHIFKISIIIY